MGTGILLLAAALVVALVVLVGSVTARTTITMYGLNDTTGGVRLGGTSFDQEAEGCDIIDISIASNQTDKLVSATFAYATLGAIIILVSQNMTLQTNNGTTPDDEFALKATRPFAWVALTGVPNPFTADVTAFYFTNTTAGTVKAFIFKDIIS
jgi:hypothetical protein